MVVGGKFALLRRLGEGGVGVVFEAEDTWIGRRVALKVLHSHLADHADVLARFRREARAAAMTHHPNIVAVFEVGQWRDGSPYIVQELLDGETLRERLLAKDRLAPDEVVEILVPIMGALAAAHKAGIVHRDIKPENIFLARTPEGGAMPKLIDFGVAKMASTDITTLTGSLLGTPMYMSPEQVSGAMEADHRTDIWAMGAVLYELLSGTCPYDGITSAVILAKILTEAPVPLTSRVRDVPPALAEIVRTALARDPAARFPSMAAMLEALLAYANQPDPTVARRHARSLPPPAPEVEAPTSVTQPASPLRQLVPEGMASDTLPEGAPAVVALDEEAFSARRASAEWARPMVQPELGWYEERATPRARRDLDWYIAAAGQALRDNALDEAIDHAEHAIVTCRAAGQVLGQMRLVQAIAFRWLGHYGDAERCALEATEMMPRPGPGWYAALGHLAMLGGYLGKNERFPTILAELGDLEAQGEVAAPHVIAACRLAVSLVRAGLIDRAEHALASARLRAEPQTEDEPMVRAWIFVAAAELAMYGGDPAGYIKHLENAVTCFAEAGDARNACLQRANIGNGYMQLGAYARAKGLLREAIAVGEPMRLGFIAPVRANLGYVMARLGDPEQALEIESAALEQCIRERYRRFELASRIYLALILSFRDERARAEEELCLAIAGAASAPPIRAYALAVLADLRFSWGRAAEASLSAEEAMSVLRELEGVEEGESLIRLVHALALESAGDVAGAHAAISEARRRLLERADRISDARLRRSFLDHIPENARTLALAARYKTPPR
jgi:serine/threonine protein kinase/tetratricopeptide (TPR) repeat protein